MIVDCVDTFKAVLFLITIDGPADALFDNPGVPKKISIPNSTLLMKYNPIKYH